MLRAGFTGSSNVVSKAVDSSFKKHYKNAKAIGRGVGAYWYSRATSYDKGKLEAEYMYKHCLKGKTFEYPIAIDVEDPVYQAKASKKRVTDAIKGFCDYLEKKGYYTIIYANSYWFNNKMYLSKLKSYDKWLANWGTSNPSSPSHGMWQFGGSTNELRSNVVAGMVVDQDYAYKDYPKIIKTSGLNGFKKSTSSKKIKYTTGEYKTVREVNVRSGPGANYKQKQIKDLTSDGIKNCTSKNKKDLAIYKKGTIFTALKIVKNKNSYWAKTPSGYVCLKYKNTVYCKKVK